MKLFKACACEDCPLSWEDRSCEGECSDCGCLVYKDLYEGSKPICRLPMRLKRTIAGAKQRKIDKAMAHRYDGVIEWYEEQQKKEWAMMSAVNDVLKKRGMFLCFHCEDQDRYYPIGSICGNGYFDAGYGEISDIIRSYEEGLKRQ